MQLRALGNRGWRETPQERAAAAAVRCRLRTLFEGSFNMQMGRILEEASPVLQKNNPQLHIEFH